MHEPSAAAIRIRFGPFTLDVRSGELRKGPTRLKVPDQSIAILSALLEQPGELVAREELRQRLWSDNTFVDFEHGLNAAVRRLRDALGDSAETPRFVETLPRRGYRFIGTIEPEPVRAAPVSISDPVMSPITETSGALNSQSTTIEQPAEAPSSPALSAYAWRWKLRFVPALMFGVGVIAALAWIAVVAGRSNSTRTVTKNMTAFVTWPSSDFNGRISPDGKYISFISDRSGAARIWMRGVAGGEPQMLTTPDGQIHNHVWSKDGKEIAYVIRIGDENFVQIVPAFFGGTPRASISIGVHKSLDELLRWGRDGLYIGRQRPRWIARLDLGSGAITELTRPDEPGLEVFQQYAVSPDEQRVAFVGRRNGRRDLFICDINGKHVTNVTDDVAEETYPIWLGQDRLFYRSTQAGQLNIWEASLTDSRFTQLSHGIDAEWPDDVSEDGAMLLIGRQYEVSRLWAVDQRSGKQWQVTSGTLNDFWPSTSLSGNAIVFQRQRPSLDQRVDSATTELIVGAWRESAVVESGPSKAKGFGPTLSPDGHWVSYRQWAVDGPSFTSLSVLHLPTQRTIKLTARFQHSGMSAVPYEQVSNDAVWAPDSSALYFSEWTDGHVARLRRYVPGAESPDARILLQHADGAAIRHLTISGDGRLLGYVKDWSEFREHVIDTGESRTLLSATTDSKIRVMAKGWREKDQTWIALRSTVESGLYPTRRVEVIALPRHGVATSLGVIEAAYDSTAVFDPDSDTLYITRLVKSVFNVFGFSLKAKSLNQVTSNTQQGVSYSGLTLNGHGPLLLNRLESHEDLWLMTLTKGG